MVRVAAKYCLLGLLFSIFLGASSSAIAGTCTSGCATITVSQYTGPIDLGCSPGDVKVKIVVDYNCGPDCHGRVTFYRCGASSDIYTFSCNVNRTFIVSVKGTWANALTECNKVHFAEQQ
jgi:hypothetical protein